MGFGGSAIAIGRARAVSRLAFGSDHAGFHHRTGLAEFARSLGHEVSEFGAASTESYDYPEASDLVAHEVLQGRADFGILICGSGIGVCIRANRYFGIRAAACYSTEMAKLAKLHNHANVLCLGERLTEFEAAKQILLEFLDTEPDGSPRHCIRVEKLDSELEA